jgi:hypothetical protein
MQHLVKISYVAINAMLNCLHQISAVLTAFIWASTSSGRFISRFSLLDVVAAAELTFIKTILNKKSG